MKIENPRSRAYKIVSMIILVILAILFLFPLYWIITGAFKPAADIYAQEPVLWPTEWVSKNFENLFNKRTAPLFSIFGIEGPTAPAAFRWLINTVFMSVMAKKRFVGRAILFSLIVCAMALPKQVILIPLLKEMAALKLYDSLWAVIFPTVGWPFGVFLMKQFSESIPGEILEATRIDGASEAKTFVTVVLPMVKPGIGALAIFTFINCWNDYFMQLVMLPSGQNFTMPLGIATLQAETSVDMGLLMAGAALAALPIIAVFLLFQKYFTQGITMGAVKG